LTEIIPESADYLKNPFSPLSLLVDKDVSPEIREVLREAAAKAVQEQEWEDYVAEKSMEKLYEKYSDETSIREFYARWESLVSWTLYDAGEAKFSPEKFGIPKP